MRQEIADAIAALPQKQPVLVARAAAGEEAGHGYPLGKPVEVSWVYGFIWFRMWDIHMG